MSFINEQVGEENRDLWESIGWKDWGRDRSGFEQKEIGVLIKKGMYICNL